MRVGKRTQNQTNDQDMQLNPALLAESCGVDVNRKRGININIKSTYFIT